MGKAKRGATADKQSLYEQPISAWPLLPVDQDLSSDSDFVPSDIESNDDADFDDSVDFSGIEDEEDDIRLASWSSSSSSNNSEAGSDRIDTPEEKELTNSLWGSQSNMKTWISKYKQLNRAFRSKFGCSISTSADPDKARIYKRVLQPKMHPTAWFLLVICILQVAWLVKDFILDTNVLSNITIPKLQNTTTVTHKKPSRDYLTECRSGMKNIHLSQARIEEYRNVCLLALQNLDTQNDDKALRSVQQAILQSWRGDLFTMDLEFNLAVDLYEQALSLLHNSHPSQRDMISSKLEVTNWFRLYQHHQLKELDQKVSHPSTNYQEAQLWLKVLHSKSHTKESVLKELSSLLVLYKRTTLRHVPWVE